ncbi:S8 family peptidase [Pendulispora albinea]|uniref:S8 family peptidase n=1 Tax=Pendulispora albinea TaxID=2741071 RepID=A0ABZ2M7M9_9BACT
MQRSKLRFIARWTVPAAMFLGAAGCSGAASDEPREDEPQPGSDRQSVVPTIGSGSGSDIILGTLDQAVPERYIVALRDDVDALQPAVDGLVAQYGGQARFTFTHAIKGFSVSMPEAAARALAANPQVRYVSRVQISQLSATQQNPPWGLDRIDQRDLPVSNSYTYPDSAGEGVTAYLLDTGVKRSHPDFENRVSAGYDFVDNDADPNDCHGHGTHTAGTVLSKTYGVAKKAKGVALRVLGCDGRGTSEQSLKAFDWVVRNRKLPAVLNYSIVFASGDRAIDEGAKKVSAAGVVFFTAAGNDNRDACSSYSPARVSELVTVGATNKKDGRALPSDWNGVNGSNYGRCLDLFGPGTGVVSTGLSGTTATMNGTSMATPHVAGVAALYLAGHPSATPQQVRDALVTGAVAKVTGAGLDTTNLLVNTGFTSSEQSTDELSREGGMP